MPQVLRHSLQGHPHRRNSTATGSKQTTTQNACYFLYVTSSSGADGRGPAPLPLGGDGFSRRGRGRGRRPPPGPRAPVTWTRVSERKTVPWGGGTVGCGQRMRKRRGAERLAELSTVTRGPFDVDVWQQAPIFSGSLTRA